jgi:P4 family phage/plasmid primase-like protien
MPTTRDAQSAPTIPYNPQLEQAALGCAFIDPSCVPVLASADPAWFFTREAQTVFPAVLAVHNESGTVDAILVWENLRDAGKEPESGGFIYVSGLRNEAVSAAMLPQYLEKLETLAAQRAAMPELWLPKYNEWEATQLFLTRIPPLKCVEKEWHVYRDGAWQRTSRDEFRPIAQAVVSSRDRTEKRERAILNHAEGARQVPARELIGFYKSDGNAVLVNANNGVVRITAKDFGLHPHDPAHAFTLKTAAGYSFDAACPLFDRVLRETLPDERDRTLLQMIVGTCLIPDSRHEAALVCYGPAGTGKSTLAEAIAAALGPDLVARLSMKQLCDSSGYHLPKLHHVAVNLGTELDSVEIEDGGIFKTLCSGEAIQVRPIYGHPYEMVTSAKLMFLSNQLPRFRHGTDGELRRLRFLRFDRKPEHRDSSLKEKLFAERDGILRWMINGCALALGTNTLPLGGDNSRAALARFGISNDPLGAFVQHRCVLEPDASELRQTLQTAFGEFCEEHGFPSEFVTHFSKQLSERFPQLADHRPRMAGTRPRAFAGIRLKKSEDE